jgi:virginiamycin B lyase
VKATVLAALSAAAVSHAVAQRDPVPPASLAPVRLAPTPARIVERCRSIQAQAGVPLLCPSLLPRSIFGGVPASPPPALSVTPIGDFFHRRIAGVDIGYGAPWEGAGWRAHRWRNRPCCFLHFDVFRRAAGSGAIPPGARPVTLGGRRGLLVAAHEGSFYGNGLYWANHVRFLWREHGVPYVATLHTFGERATERLLGRLVASLRPVEALRPPAARGVAVGVTPAAVAVSGGSVWVAALGDLSRNFRGTIYQVDARSDRIVARLRPGGRPHALALLRGAVWTATEGAVVELDASSRRRVRALNVGRYPRALVVLGGRLWAMNATPFGARGSLVQVGSAQGRPSGAAVRLGRAPVAAAAGFGSIWVADELDGRLFRVDPATRRVVGVLRVGPAPTAVAAGVGAVWVANTGSGTVSRVDPRTSRVDRTFRVGRAPRGIAVGGGAVWVATTGSGTVRRIDTRSGRVTTAARSLVDPLAVAWANGTLWATTNDGELVRLRRP